MILKAHLMASKKLIIFGLISQQKFLNDFIFKSGSQLNRKVNSIHAQNIVLKLKNNRDLNIYIY